MPLQITYSQGGRQELIRTGVYSRKLIVYDPRIKKRWTRKITKEKSTGELKLGDKVIYRYDIKINGKGFDIYDHNDELINDYEMTFVMVD